MRRCSDPACGKRGLVCPNCLIERGTSLRRERSPEPPEGCEWGPSQPLNPADVTPTPEEVAAADTGKANEWGELLQRSVELEEVAARQAREQEFLAESWVRLQQDRDALAASRRCFAWERDGAIAFLAAATVLLTWTLPPPEHARAGVTWVALTAAGAWFGRRWILGGDDARVGRRASGLYAAAFDLGCRLLEAVTRPRARRD